MKISIQTIFIIAMIFFTSTYLIGRCSEECPTKYAREQIMPLSFKGQIYSKYVDSANHAEPYITFITAYTTIKYSVMSYKYDYMYREVALGDSIFKAIHSLDIIIKKPNGDTSKYIYQCSDK